MKFLVSTLLITAVVLSGCKKDHGSDPQKSPDAYIAGTYNVISFAETVNGVQTLNVDLTTAPCIAGNTAIYNADHTSTGYFAGSTACYLTPNEVFGIPGEDTVHNTWELHGNVLVSHRTVNGVTFTYYSTVRTVNGKNEITDIDTTFGQANYMLISKVVYVEK